MIARGVVPYSRQRLSALTMGPRHVAVAAVALAAAASVAAVLVSATQHPDPAIRIENSTVSEVLPGGPAWNNGIRVGHRVIELDPGATAADWQLWTTDGQFEYASTGGNHVWTLREAIPTAGFAVLAAFVAAMALRSAPALGTGFAALAVILASVPFGLTGDPVLSTSAMVLAPVVGAVWAVSWRVGPVPVRLALVLAVSAAVAAWLLARLVEPRLFGTAENVRLAAVVLTASAVLVFGVPWRSVVGIAPFGRGRLPDVAFLAVATAGVASAAVYFSLTPLFVGVALVFVLVVYGVARGAVVPLLDRMLFAELRERASMEAGEDERARLAADLHDVPLQELTGIIHRLEASGEVGDAPQLLRAVAAHIRAVTTELRPPVLDDLGLGPAIGFLAGEAGAASSAPVVVQSIADRTGVEREERCPALVELAVFRIVQEALNNARQHAGASHVWIEGQLAPEAIALTIRDNGGGLTAETQHSASRRGRLGLTSMRARAAAIDATLTVEADEPSGTRITLIWRAT